RGKDGRVTSWIFRYHFGGRERAKGLGSTDSVTLAKVREDARALREMLAAGKDPLDEDATAPRPAAGALTFTEASKQYFEQFKATLAPKQQKRWENSMAAQVLPIIGHLRAGAITTDDVLRVLRPLWSAQPDSARRLRGRVEAVLNFARIKEKREGYSNPAQWRGVLALALPSPRKLRKVRHHPSMPYNQVPSFMRELRERTEIEAKAPQLLLLCNVRTGDVPGQKSEDKPPVLWDHLDLDDERIWTVPSPKGRHSAPLRVPLSGPALALLRKLKAVKLHDTLVFPDLPKNKMLQLIQGKMGYAFTTHGYKSSFRRWASKCTSFKREVVETAMCHRVARDDVEGAYLYDEDYLIERRGLMQAWAEYCGSDTGKVIPLHA